MKLKGEINYFFAIPLLQINITEYSIHIPKQFAFCSIYYPAKLQDFDNFYYFIKVYSLLDKDYQKTASEVMRHDLLFGESRYIPFIVVKGEMKWILIDKISETREINSFANLKLSNLKNNYSHEDKKWFLLKNSGLRGEPWNQFPRPYEEVKQLEYGDEMSEITVKFRIYIEILKLEFFKRGINIEIGKWKEILYSLIIKEPSTKKSNKLEIKENFIESYIYDYLQ